MGLGVVVELCVVSGVMCSEWGYVWWGGVM